MERNRWETAIRCLEIAVHPNTSDEELVAAINGFRRTADGAPLARLLTEIAAADRGNPAAAAGHLLARLDQLNQENRALQLKIAEAEANRAATLHHLDEVERRARGLRDELAEAEHNATAAEAHLVAFRGAYDRISGGLHGENGELRRALAAARRDRVQPIHEPVAPFQHMLNNALQRTDRPSAAVPMPTSTPSWRA